MKHLLNINNYHFFVLRLRCNKIVYLYVMSSLINLDSFIDYTNES